MSDLDNAINSINASAVKAENTAGFLDDMSTFDDQSSVTNPNNGQTVASIPKQVRDRTDELFTAAESDINQAVADAAQSATDAQDAADSIGRYQGLWPDTGGSANKGDTYQTQVSGTPTGRYFTALQNTTVDPVGDDVNWRAVIGSDLGSVNNGTKLQHRRGTNAEILAGTPETGELWFNTTDNSIHMGDGVTMGGIKHVNEKNIGNFTDLVFDSVDDMIASDLYKLNDNLKVQGENDIFTNYKVVNTSSDVDLGGGLWAKLQRQLNSRLDAVDQAFGGMTTATNGAGLLTGTVEYDMTYYTADGETNRKALSNPLAVSNEKVLITQIPIGTDSRIIGRRIYRNVQGAPDVVLKKLVVDIPDNTTTQYEDNIPDGSLGALNPWDNTTGGQLFINDDLTLISNDNCLKLGYNAHPNHTGYANVALGPDAMKASIDAYRCTAVGLYSLTSLKSGAQNTGMGVHAFQYLKGGNYNTGYGYGSAFYLEKGSHNTLVGDEAGFKMGLQLGGQDLSQHTAIGSRSLHEFQGNSAVNKPNTVLGYRACFDNQYGAGNLMLGAYAGAYGQYSNTCVIDNMDRGDQQGVFDNSPIIINMDSDGAQQRVKINGQLKSQNSEYYSDVSGANAGAQMNQKGEWIFSTGPSTTAANSHAFYSGGVNVGVIQVRDGTTTEFVNLSDKNMKKNITSSKESAVDQIQKINVVEFDYSVGKKTHVNFGFTAQGLHNTNPDCGAVSVGSDDSELGSDEYKAWGIDNSKLVPMLVKAIQELNDKISKMEGGS